MILGSKYHRLALQCRKYQDHPAINYEDFVVDASGVKKYRMKCLTCSKDKGHRRLDSINLPCFPCAMAKTKKYTPIQKQIREATKARLSSRLRRIKNGQAVTIHFKEFPWTLEELMKHLESKFQPGMTWENYGINGWHIDHIRPDSSFVYSSSKDPDFLKCWSLENLQPLWAIDNFKKGAKYEKVS